MNKAPLRRSEHRYLGDEPFPDGLSSPQIERFFTLDEQELGKVRERRSPLNIPTGVWALGVVRVFNGVSPGASDAFPSKSDTGHRPNTIRTAGMIAEFGVADV